MTRKVLAGIVVLTLALAAGATWSAKPAKSKTTEQAAEAQIGAVRDAIVDALWIKTDEYWHGGNSKPVIGICKEVVQLDPQFVDAYNVGAWVAMQHGQEDVAVQFYKQGMANNPDSFEILHEYGFMYLQMHKKDVAAALPYLKRAAEAPSPVRIKRTYAHALEKLGRYKQSAAEWHKILKIDPKDMPAQRALKKLRKAGKIGPKD